MRQLRILIDWFDDSSRVLGSEANAPIMVDETTGSLLQMLAHVCATVGSAGDTVLLFEGCDWNRRTTYICLTNGRRSRSLTIDQRRDITEEEAGKCASTLMDWVLAADTTELLEA